MPTRSSPPFDVAHTPMIVVIDHERDLTDRLFLALRAVDGTTPRIFVKDHATCSDTVVVLLPPGGPSLAAALRDWVADWWSDGDDDEYGTPEQYLAGFGVVIDAGDYGTFSTSCPYCGAEDTLTVASGTFSAMGLGVQADGFAFDDAQSLQTEDEQIFCSSCQRTFSADDIRL